jgi:MFS family permease
VTRETGAGGSRIAASLRDRFLARQRIGRQLAGISLFGALGSGMYYASSALYFTTVVGLTAGQVGTGLSIAAAVGLAGQLPVGMLADRLRVGHVYIGTQVLRGLVFTGFCLVGSFAQFVAVAAFAGLTEAALPSLLQVIVGKTVPEADRVDTLAKVRAVRSVGFGLGALVATAAISQGSRAAFVTLVALNAASYFVIAAGLLRAGVGKVAVVADRSKRPTWRFLPDGRYVLTGLLSGVLWVHVTLLFVGMPLWFVRYTAMPKVFVGVLVAVNTVLAAVLASRFARSSSTVPGAARTALRAGLALAGFGIACQLARQPAATAEAVVLAFAAVILLSFAGLWQTASSWSLSFELADPDHQAAYLSTFQLGYSLQAVAAPWIITNVIFRVQGGWLLFSAVVVAAGALVRLPVRHRSPEPTPKEVCDERAGI